MAKQHFRVHHIHAADDVAVVEMEDSLLAPEAGILDPETATLSPIKNGRQFTLIPIDDHKVATLMRVKAIYENVTTKPAKLFTTSISRMDELLIAVGLLFGTVEYVVINDKTDLANLINPPKDYEPTKVKHVVLDELLAAIGYVPEETEHKCGAGCGHDHSAEDEE